MEDIRLCRNWVGDGMRQCGWRRIVGEYIPNDSFVVTVVDKRWILILLSCRLTRHVAIKFCKSDRRHDGEEAQTLSRLSKGPTSHPGKDHVIHLLDRFELSGPNGRHSCLVTDALGPRVEPDELSPRSAWEVAKQLMEATAYSHDLGITHGGTSFVSLRARANGQELLTHSVCADLHSDRVLFCNTSLLNWDRDPTEPLKKPKIGNVRAVDKFGNVESILGQTSTARVPRYLVESLQAYPASLRLKANNDSRIKIIGFGERFLAGKTHGARFAFNYQAPELIFGSKLSPKADIWSLGCLVCSSIGLSNV